MLFQRLSLIMLAVSVFSYDVLAVDEVSSPFVGVTHIHRMRTMPRTLDIHILIIDLKAPGLSFRVTPSNGATAGETDLQTVRNFLIEQNAQIAINAGFFYDTGSGYDVMGFAASDGDNYSPFVTWYDFPTPLVALNISSANVATVINYDPWFPTNPTGIYNAAPGSERIVNNGVNVTSTTYSLNTALHPRTGAGITQDQKLVLFTVDGRNPGHSNGMYTREMADMLIEFGVYKGLNFDGGGSTTLVFADPNARLVNVPVGISNVPNTERLTANNIAVFAQIRQAVPVKTTFCDFEKGDEGTFAYTPGYSGSTAGIIEANSTADAVSTQARAGSWSQCIFIKDDPDTSSVSENPTGGWFVRHVSGSSASPSQNLQRPATGYMGLWAKTNSAAVRMSICIDNEGAMERGVPMELTADGQWHVYEWDLGDNSQWQGWINGDGIITNTTFSLDSIQLLGPNADSTIYIDDVTHNPIGSITGPGSCEDVWSGGEGIVADFDRNCRVDMLDFQEFAANWLGITSRFDISPATADGTINFGDFAVLAAAWFECNDPDDQCGF